MRLYPGQRVLVLGLAKSGAAAARLLIRRGLQVVVNDRRERAALEADALELERLGAQTVFGGHPLTLLEPRPDFIVKNPGIPYHVPLVAAAVSRGIPVYTELEVASWLTDAPIYAITGSNGKTTTTTLVGEMLTAAGQDPVVAGNIGRALCDVVEQAGSQRPLVLEVSSFQLLGTERFHPRIAALLNLYPAHLDYHETFEAYMAAKWKIFSNMSALDVAVLNWDHPQVREGAARVSAQVVWFSRRELVTEGLYVRDGAIRARRGNREQPVIRVAEVALRGEHNLENILAAAAIAIWAGAPAEAVRDVLRRFRGVEHRIEYVRAVGGVDYYNDSKATNPQAALRALRSFDNRVVWIAGGLDRGDDFTVLQADLARHVRAAVLLGQSAPRLAAVCQAAGVPRVELAGSLEEAVRTASQLAGPGDVVLLSPACASWDMFTSFEERGRMFKELVHTL
ncbi:MAG: UDP-N-acetylmuramoyl-L-alanine--D-glutamate ligase [Alicyclobacillaceae bacterium]|nr:UDP-N-acetylmuramoyl-L-alanine--D-glutamate ligase [Alicyclobacillaceae bacterium]